MNINESIIRDKLSTMLEILESGLTLLEIEKYLPNPQGTKGFVDILAKDRLGRYVLIELKRSDAASRQAIHEVLKYVEGSKINLAAKNSELRVFIVSTEWNELLIPFSSFIEKTSLETVGFKLHINEDGTPINAERVSPVPLIQDRLFISQHEINLYVSYESLKKGIESYEAICANKEIRDYVLISLKAHPEFRTRELESVRQAIAAMGLPPKSDNELEAKVTQHTHMLYFAPLKMDDEACLQLIKSRLETDNPEDLEEFLEYLNNLENPRERSSEIHEKIFEIDPRPHADYIDMGYPAKFIKILDEEKWNIVEIKRYGKISNNTLLTDNTIISEVRGEQGVTRQKYQKELLDSSPKELDSVANEIAACLEDNPIWKNHILTSLRELKDSTPAAKTTISVFNPSNIVLSIFNYVAREDGVFYIPGYRIISEFDTHVEMIFGNIEPTGRRPSISQLIDTYYEHTPRLLLTSLSWGGYERRDAKIMRDIGLRYCTYKLVQNDSENLFWKLSELGWEPVEPIFVHEALDEFINVNEDFVRDIYDFYSAHWNGFMVTFNGDKKFEFRT